MGDKLRKEDYIYFLDDDEEETKKKKTAKKQKHEVIEEERPVRAAKSAPKKAAAVKKPAPSAKKSAPKKKKKKKSHFFTGLLVVILILALIAAAAYLLDRKGIIKLPFDLRLPGGAVTVSATKKPEYDQMDNIFADIKTEDNNDGLDASQANSINVTELSITEGLDENWFNVLLLGTDTRVSYEAARSDTMMICSINKVDGRIKLTSIMRDTAVKINGKTTRINSAYFYGGPQLAMKIVNEYFGMNISSYVVVDFSGFASIAEALGGVDMNITKAEMDWINHNVQEQYKLLYTQKKMDYEDAKAGVLANQLTTYGSNIHLSGMQTLGYARIRKTDSDYARAERQRAVLNALLEKLKGADATKLMTLAVANASCYKTNLSINNIVSLGLTVLGNSSFSGASELRLPVNGTYKEEARNNDAMLYDMDVQANIKELYKFIYQ